ncbi:hypothetical protein [Nocardia farcinica]|uniref:hypothetical protein n=1 Tax=Nocardia farcinica TaxID=37329 RepID=UPI002458F3DF|nr:hypothetical protein [Nocardia farcinica]
MSDRNTNAEARTIAWATYRKAYGVSAAALNEAHKAFLAGWDARGEGIEEGVQR